MNLYKLGASLIVIGIIIVLVSIALFALTLTKTEETPNTNRTRGGFAGCIIIFFIPICFSMGSPDIVNTLLVIILILSLILFTIFFILPWSYVRKFKKFS